MPNVASLVTDVPCPAGVPPTAEVHVFFTGIELIGYEGLGFAEGLRGRRTRRSGGHDYRLGDLGGARIGLAHNTIPTVFSPVTILEGATYGTG